MKKALTVFLMLALVGSVFAAEPVADVNIAEFSGNASVQWGVDLDAGKTGFKNAYEVVFKLNLLNNGTKSTTGDGVWGELVLKTDGDSFVGWKNTAFSDGAFGANEGMGKDLSWKVFVDTAKVHFGPAYIGIKSGDTQTGELKMDAAVRSADNDNAKWLNNVGPADYTQGIVAGYSHDMFNVAADVRSYFPAAKVWSVTWTDGSPIVDGRTSPAYFGDKDSAEAFKAKVDAMQDAMGATSDAAVNGGDGTEWFGNGNQYSNAYAFALEGEFTGVENLSVKAGVSYNFNDGFYADAKQDKKTSLDNTLGYSASAGYKLALDDTYYIRPQLGFTGSTVFGKRESGKIDATLTSMSMAAGILFGWGDIGVDANAGVPFLDDDDQTKKVSPGVGVVVSVPLPTSLSMSGDKSVSVDYTGNQVVRIMPSFFSGEIVPNLTAAAFADIVMMRDSVATIKSDGNTYEYKDPAANKDVAMAVAFGAKYAIAAGDMTITPNVGVRFMNDSYFDNGITLLNTPFGEVDRNQQRENKNNDNVMNLKAGVDVTGLIDNTTLSVIYDSRNLLNSTDYKGDNNPAKLGTLNFKVKIAL